MRMTEKEVMEKFKKLSGEYNPLRFSELKERVATIKGFQPDAITAISLEDGPSYAALIEFVPVASPKSIKLKCRMLVDYIRELGQEEEKVTLPIIAAPFIGGTQAEILKEQGVSWLDLSGNMMIKVPGRIYIERTGNKNKFPDTSPIKKIFQGTSSLVSRALLLKTEGFSSQYELVDFINSRNAAITAATVSRVLKSLEEELLINKTKSSISVINPEKLLDKLTDGYINLSKRKGVKKYKFSVEDVKRIFCALFERGVDYAACGFYAAQIKGLAVTTQATILIKNYEEAKKAFNLSNVKVEPDSEFGNLTLVETKDNCVWFNIKKVAPLITVTVDDIELYLEMLVDTPRGPKIAELLRKRILGGQSDGRQDISTIV